MRTIVAELLERLRQGREALLCQVVETRGSTPQKAGATMLVDPLGGQVGTLGGGCVEAEVKQKAIRRLGQPGAELFHFVLDHDYAWADGLICGGKMVILTECVSGPGPLAYFEKLLGLLDRGEGFTEVVALDPERCGASIIGARYLFDRSGHCVAGCPDEVAPETVVKSLSPLDDRPKAGVWGGAAFLPTLPRVRLLIVGAGHVGQAVGELAARADFDIWVVDDRAQYANRERFPQAQEIRVGPIEEILPTLEISPQTYTLIVTRGHGHDQEALGILAPTAAAYVGLIGSRRKIRMILENLREQGIADEALGRVTAPVGIDIGSQTVFEIAVSIVAELIARRNVGELRFRETACSGSQQA